MIHVLRNVATSVEKHYFEAADAGALKTAFSDIATNILEAATDVHVEDKIGKGYVVNFGLPTANFDKLPSAEMGGIDGEGSTEFYMQVLNYKLDPVTNERTGTPAVLEKFTFNLDGTLKSHTVAGQACGDTCNHVTTSGGKITKIDGTYALDRLYATASPEQLQTQLDTCWVKVAGEDPVEYIHKYAGRMPTIHLKDYAGQRTENMYALIGIDDDKEQEASDVFEFRPLGHGLQDIPAIVAAATEGGAEWFIVEQDLPSMGYNAMECAKISVDYLLNEVLE
jgi:hypothetical protein